LQVLVRDSNIEQALRVLKKKMQREALFREEGSKVLPEAFRKRDPAKG
jgi:ribosomal protein S21